MLEQSQYIDQYSLIYDFIINNTKDLNYYLF
jgi:hypothetical protein